MTKKIICGIAVLTATAFLANKKKKRICSKASRKTVKRSSNCICDYCEPCYDKVGNKDKWMYWL